MLFSIIMCTYHSQGTLARAIDSVRSQRYTDWELLVLDNGSKDNTAALLAEYQEADTRIRCIYRNDNIGWCMGIRVCLEQASGAYMMFLGADDFLPDCEVLGTVAGQIEEYEPDVVWTGCGFAVLEEGQYQLITRTLPEYRVYEKEDDKLKVLSELMRQVYYNSVMHYVRIDFIRSCGIDFYEPFYGDCQSMTEAICRAGRMVVLDKMAYILVVNTSQTATVTGFDYDVSRQWNSVKSILPQCRETSAALLCKVAGRILDNLTAMCQEIVTGGALRDSKMNTVEKNWAQRFRKAEEWISSAAFGEMMYYAGREKYAEQLIGAAGILYWEGTCFPEIKEQIRKESGWLADFAEGAMERKEDGQIAWRGRIGHVQEKAILRALTHSGNPHRIGCELALRDGIRFENPALREQIRKILHEYLIVVGEKGLLW